MKSYAVVDPRAMMVHVHDTFATSRTMMGSFRLKIMANYAILSRILNTELS